VKPRARREVAEWVKEAYQVSERLAARLVRLERGTLRYLSRRDPLTRNQAAQKTGNKEGEGEPNSADLLELLN
jgi:hypothetical protein